MKKRIMIFSAMIIAMIMLGACGTDNSEPAGNTEDGNSDGSVDEPVEEASTEASEEPKDELGEFEIQLEGKVVEEGDNFIVEGQSNLLPGASLIGEVIVSEDEVFSDTTERVQEDGSFYMEIPHHEYGEADIVVRFDFNNVQEDPILRHYGERGQNLEGPIVYKHEFLGDIYKKAEVRVSYDPQEKGELVFEIPDWNELPEDYGDPRVWIEVDEITEDGEFYYLKGRSNLLEGSEIRGSFASNSDSAVVMPDGSFELEIEYVYKEEEDFTIEFNPMLQWNEIEEAYGSKGQKLVGNLVVHNEISGNQRIEKVIPWDGDNATATENDVEETEQEGITDE